MLISKGESGDTFQFIQVESPGASFEREETRKGIGGCKATYKQIKTVKIYRLESCKPTAMSEL